MGLVRVSNLTGFEIQARRKRKTNFENMTIPSQDRMRLGIELIPPDERTIALTGVAELSNDAFV